MGTSEKATLPSGGLDPAGVAGLIGEKLDNRYVIQKVLGEGGMGVVYLGVHEALERPVAVKVLRPEVSRDEKTVARFKREARAASAIGSPHICDVSDFGELEDGSTYFVMEMLDGPSLGKAMKRGEPMEIPRLLKIGSQLCDALGAAHARGIVHRDLKPDNVHLVKQNTDPEFVKVLDFGIAKVQNTQETKLTQAGQVFGTPHYMSPEQCAGHEVDQRTDIYALGVMLYEMACGRVPFDADNLMGLLTKHVYEQPIPPRELPPPVDVPPGVEAVILKCLAKQPASRYQQMSELKADLEALRAGKTPEAVMSEIDRSLPEMPSDAYRSVVPGELPAAAPPAPDRNYLAIGGGIGVLLLLLGGGIFAAIAFTGPGETPDTPPVDAPIADPGPVEDLPDDPTPEDPEPADTVATMRLDTNPPHAEVLGPDGSLIGNTPVDLPKPAAGEPPIEYQITLVGFEPRTFRVSSTTGDSITLSMNAAEADAPPTRRGRRRGNPAGRSNPTSMDPSPTTMDSVVAPPGPSSGDLQQVDWSMAPSMN